MKSIYTYYKERLIEISGKNRSLYLKTFSKKNGYDVGKLLYQNQELANELIENLWNGRGDSFELIGKSRKDVFEKNVKIDENTLDNSDPEAKKKADKQHKDAVKKAIESEVKSLITLKREIEEIERETGRSELYLCYPFVYGNVKTYTFRAPLLMFPVEIDIESDTTAFIRLKTGEPVQLNKALMYAFADAKRLNLEELETEFDCMRARFSSLQKLLDYLASFGIKIAPAPRKNIFPFDRYPEPKASQAPEIKNLCLLARCSLANSIYNDYAKLEKKHLANESINQLLNRKVKKHKGGKEQNLYLINNVDYAQEQVVRKVNDSGSMVIYGPPGTGKSQTIVNVISDAIAKGKKVLVVSQKKAALDVVYNRLGKLNTRAMFVVESEKEKRGFYERCQTTHNKLLAFDVDKKAFDKFEELQTQIKEEENKLEEINSCLNEPTPFGLSLQAMYYNSFKIGKHSVEYSIYQQILNSKKLLSMSYQELKDALSVLNEPNKTQLYYNFIENKKKNPFIDHLKLDAGLHVIAQAQSKLSALCQNRQALFDGAEYKYSRQILTYFSRLKDKNDLKTLQKMVAKLEYPKSAKFLKTSVVLFPLYPFAKYKMVQKERAVANEFEKTITALNEYLEEYEFLKDVLTDDGYLMAVDGLLNGNSGILKLILNAVENFVANQDISKILNNLTENQKFVLNFAYKNANSYQKYMEILNKIMPLRLYHEIVFYEDKLKDKLAMTADFDNIRAKIVELKKEENDLSKQIALQSFVEEYKNMINGSIESKDFLYQISKKQNYWSIRKMMEVYGNYLFKMFPCWLLSPENVSSILPLEKDMFDIVLFDEASQVFIENTIPSIFRGKCIVVAGDAKQLRPTTTFMKRYMGANLDEDVDLSTQAALEVESLLDLAVSRFNSANITYHYRSKNQELIDFSNKAFYSGNLQIAPNVSKNLRQKPIERILVEGKWSDRKNVVEAKKVVEITKQILKTRKHGETIGIITFNAEQEACIEDLFDKECFKDEDFRSRFIRERSRVENDEDVSLFIKNLENVQGDERDIIIFSIGYARNEFGKVNASFGSLSNEGGENRFNVAITRAKQKIYVVTSIEPEELKVDGAKYAGPKLLRSYLSYARAVSKGKIEEVKAILDSFNERILTVNKTIGLLPLEEQIQKKLGKLGYNAEVNLGNSDSKISVAVYDKGTDRYLVGIETDQTAINSSASVVERDVYRNEFLKSRGWKVIRVWSRDWWHNYKGVTSQIVKEIEKQKKNLKINVKETKSEPKKKKVENRAKVAKKSELKIDKPNRQNSNNSTQNNKKTVKTVKKHQKQAKNH